MGDRRCAKQLIVLGLMLLPMQVFAQRFAADSRMYFDYGDESYVSSHELPAADSLAVFINTANALFSFVRSDRALSARGAFYAVRDIAVELRESPAGKVLATRNTRDTIFENEFAETTSKDVWNSRVVSVSLAGIRLPQSVEVHTEIRDGFLSRLADRASNEPVQLRAFSRNKTVTAKDTSYIGIGDPYLFDANISGCTYCARNYGKLTEFSRDLSGCVPLAFAVKETIDSVVITLTEDNDHLHTPGFQPKKIATTTIAARDFISGQTLVVAGADSVISFATISRTDSTASFAIAPFHFAGSRLEMGDYHFDIKAYSNADNRTTRYDFELVWHDMPLSLENARDAVAPMQFILSDEEFAKLSSGSNTEQMRKLFEYWSSQDPTPGTAFNERMAEFYRRADYAYFNFARNSRQLDGAMTDRGKVYILFGPPTNIRRSFLVGEQPLEIWTYSNNVKKTFKFISQGGNEFKLAEVKPM
ncbi:MAG TPA: GWxTD domain-containing protein [Candidatus Kapabacteria bacterium]|nr:GWxTD domain-containing protein [Candidatus Kapabacteria bacterium]